MDKRYNTIASQNTKLIHIIIWTDSYIEKLSPAASNNAPNFLLHPSVQPNLCWAVGRRTGHAVKRIPKNFE